MTYQVSDAGEYVAIPSKTGKFVEAIIAPEFTKDAIEYISQKSKTIRLLRLPLGKLNRQDCIRGIIGGFLIQGRDDKLFESMKTPTKLEFMSDSEGLVKFGLHIVRQVMSNAIVIVDKYDTEKYRLLGIGSGQPNRVEAIRKLAIPKAVENLTREHKVKGGSLPLPEFIRKKLAEAVLVSDAFFPFDDNVKVAAIGGIRQIVQPGGSAMDKTVIKTCDDAKVAMIFTGLRHFRH